MIIIEIYIILFVLVLFLSVLIEKYKNNKISYFFAGILLFALSIVAGVRTIDMGWDASKYVVSTFFRLNYFDGDLMSFLNETTVETGFSIYSWILYKIYPNVNFLMFGYSFITTLFVMIFAFREKNTNSISKILIIYYLTLYLVSYNIIRQSISTVILLVSLSLFKDKKHLKALIVFCLALTFHDSAILGIPIYILYIIITKNTSNKIKIRRSVLISFMALLLCCLYSDILQIAYKIGLMSNKYYNYFMTYDKIDYNLSNIFINAYWLLFAWIFINRVKEEKKFGELCFIITLFSISLLINVISIKIHPIYRVGYYYYYTAMFNFVPRFNTYIKKDEENQKIGKVLVYGVLILMFLWMTVWGNGHNIYPYQSEILKVL